MGNLQGLGIVLFALFAITLAAMYILVRRRLAPIGVVAGVGTVINVILVTLISLASGNMALQAIIVGPIVGVLFSGAAVAMAAYFLGNEVARAEARKAFAPAARAAQVTAGAAEAAPEAALPAAEPAADPAGGKPAPDAAPSEEETT